MYFEYKRMTYLLTLIPTLFFLVSISFKKDTAHLPQDTFVWALLALLEFVVNYWEQRSSKLQNTGAERVKNSIIF